MKRVFWNLARRAGLLSAWRRKNRHRIGILMAHGVMDDGPGTSWRPLWRRLHVEQLERILGLLQQYHEFVSLAEATQMLRGERRIRPYCMVLTFDDGYRNNLTHALPVLERLKVPAAFFLSTGLVGTTRSFWIDRLDYAIQHLPSRPRHIPVGSSRVTLNFENRDALAVSYQQLRLAMKDAYKDDLDERVELLASELEQEGGARLADVIETDPWTAVMNWEEARAASRRGVEIGSHTVDHVRLGLVDANVAMDELARSRSDIEQELGVDCTCIAYPSGSFTPETARLAQRTGYQCALTTRAGLNSQGDDVFMLRRFNFPTKGTIDHVLASTSGFEMALRQLGRSRTA